MWNFGNPKAGRYMANLRLCPYLNPKLDVRNDLACVENLAQMQSLRVAHPTLSRTTPY
jgi:hypothetical protein